MQEIIPREKKSVNKTGQDCRFMHISMEKGCFWIFV